MSGRQAAIKVICRTHSFIHQGEMEWGFPGPPLIQPPFEEASFLNSGMFGSLSGSRTFCALCCKEEHWPGRFYSGKTYKITIWIACAGREKATNSILFLQIPGLKTIILTCVIILYITLIPKQSRCTSTFEVQLKMAFWSNTTWLTQLRVFQSSLCKSWIKSGVLSAVGGIIVSVYNQFFMV